MVFKNNEVVEFIFLMILRTSGQKIVGCFKLCVFFINLIFFINFKLKVRLRVQIGMSSKLLPNETI